MRSLNVVCEKEMKSCPQLSSIVLTVGKVKK